MQSSVTSRDGKRGCLACVKRFRPTRLDARYCSAACRQRAHRARAHIARIDREIEATRLHYWQLIERKAHALGVSVGEVLVDESQSVDDQGQVEIHGRLVGKIRPYPRGSATEAVKTAGTNTEPVAANWVRDAPRRSGRHHHPGRRPDAIPSPTTAHAQLVGWRTDSQVGRRSDRQRSCAHIARLCQPDSGNRPRPSCTPASNGRHSQAGAPRCHLSR